MKLSQLKVYLEEYELKKNQTSIFALVSSSNLLAIKLLGNMDFYHVSLRLFVFFFRDSCILLSLLLILNFLMVV